MAGRFAHVQIASVPERHEPDEGELNYPHLYAVLDRAGSSAHLQVDGGVSMETIERAAEAGAAARSVFGLALAAYRLDATA